VESKHASVNPISSAGEPASHIAPVESVASPRRSRTRRPWNRSGHPERIPYLIRGNESRVRELGSVGRRSSFRLVVRGFEPVVHGFEARTRWLRHPRPASRRRTSRPRTPFRRPPKRLLASCSRASDTHSRRSRVRNPWNRSTRPPSRSAWPASWSRARRRREPGTASRRSRVRRPPIRSPGPASRVGPLVVGAAPGPASRVRGRFPESEPTPAEAVEGSSSDEREPLIRGIGAYACRSRPRLVFRWIRASTIRANRSLPSNPGAASGKPAAAPTPEASVPSASKLTSSPSASVARTSSRRSPCGGSWQQAAP
jgi:hypothetical protein